jgi:hypothetical protein
MKIAEAVLTVEEQEKWGSLVGLDIVVTTRGESAAGVVTQFYREIGDDRLWVLLDWGYGCVLDVDSEVELQGVGHVEG